MRLLIVGAGPTGTALGYLLARRGVDVVLLERETDFDRVFRGEALMPSGVDAIRQMGLQDEFAGVPHRKIECMEFYLEGSRVLRAAWPEIAGPNAAYLVSQPALLEMITQAAARHPTFELWIGATVRNIRVPNLGVELDVEKKDGGKSVAGDFVVGADGRGSTVRARAGLKLNRLPFPFDVIWVSLPVPPTQHDDPRFQGFSRGDTTLALYPSWDDRLRLGLNLPAQSSGRAPLTRSDLVEGIARTVGEPYAGFIRKHAKDMSEPLTLKILFGRCDSWSAPRTLLLGDAAHPMSPVRAQGINLALRDAIVAANHLVPALDGGDIDALQCAATRIQQEREPEIIESQRLQVATARPASPARFALFRTAVLPVLNRLGILKRLFLHSEIPLRHGVVPVRLTV